MIINGIKDLAKLPYFDLQDDTLIMDPALGPAIDMHAHLALSFIAPPQVDLRKESPETFYYLPSEATFNLEKYASHNIPPEDFKKCKRDLSLMALTPWGKRTTHTVPNLLRDMKNNQIEKTLLLAIDQPLLSWNSETFLAATSGDERFITFASVHPLNPRMEKKLDQLLELGARGIKMHPMAQSLRPDHPKARRLYRLCGERNLPVFFHCGPVGVEPYLGRMRSQVKLYRRPIEECPDTTFILGHSGALQSNLGTQLARDFPHVYLELVGPTLTQLKEIIEKAPIDRIFYGSDWPFYHQAFTLSKVLLVTEGAPELRRKLLYENALAFLEKVGKPVALSHSKG